MDIGLKLLENLQTDIYVNNGDIGTDNELETALIISLFCDARASSDDDIGSADPRGWWADNYSNLTNDKTGSKLWLLSREKITNQTINRAREYVLQATQWLVDDGIANKITVDITVLSGGIVKIKIDVYRNSGVKNYNFDYLWRQINEF